METYLPYLWLAVIIFAVVMESLTVQLVSIWFMVGGIGALIANLCGAELMAQMLIFVTITALMLAFTRPIVKNLIDFKKEDTNVGRYIGKNGVVIAQINNILGEGQVNVLGNVWSARSKDGFIIKTGENVRIKSIEGVKLIVEID